MMTRAALLLAAVPAGLLAAALVIAALGGFSEHGDGWGWGWGVMGLLATGLVIWGVDCWLEWWTSRRGGRCRASYRGATNEKGGALMRIIRLAAGLAAVAVLAVAGSGGGG